MQPTHRSMFWRNSVRHFAARHHVGDGKAAARFQYAESLAQHAVLIAGKVDDAVADDDVHGVIRQRDMLDFAFQKLDILDPCLALVLPRQCEHFIRHIEAVSFAGRAQRAAPKAARRCRRRSRDRAPFRPD